MASVKGYCEIFAGIRLMTPFETYDIDPIYATYYDGKESLCIIKRDEKTKQRLIAGMAPLGIVCEPDDISINNEDIKTGTKHCWGGKWTYTPQNETDAIYFQKRGYIQLNIDGMPGSWEVYIRKTDVL